MLNLKMNNFLDPKMTKSQPNLLRVLTYHRVADPKDSAVLDPRLISTDPATFERQMQYLTNHYQVVSLEEVFNAVESKGHLPKGAVLITFDDAYFDLAHHALPILKRWQLPATIFVPTAYPDRPDLAFWWDRIYRAFAQTAQKELDIAPIGKLSLKTSEDRRQSNRRIKQRLLALGYAEAMNLVDDICYRLDSKPLVQKSLLSWEELRQVAKEGVTLGAHTRTHPYLIRLSSAQMHEEIVGAQQDLKREIGHTFPVFCYPNGDHNKAVVDTLRQAGFVLAFTTMSGQNDLNTADLLRLNRQSIYPKTSLPIFCLRLLRVGGYLDRWRLRKERQQYI